MTVGEPLAAGAIELVAERGPGLDPDRIATDASTAIAQGALGVRGRVVLVDIDDRGIAVFVRDLLPPHHLDVDRLEAVLAAFRRCGVDDLVTGPADAVLRERFADPPPFWDPSEQLTRTFLDRAVQQGDVFPTTWWHDDPSAGVDEMAELVEELGGKRFPRSRLVKDAQRALDRSDDEEMARDELCARLCEAANDVLAKARVPRRFCGPYFSDVNGGEPNWLLTTPPQFPNRCWRSSC